VKPVDARRRWARWRDRLRERPVAEVAYRITVAIVGVAVLGLGVLAIPYPGPGWAIVFIGLGILATEFRWAQRLLMYTKRHYDKAMTWFRAQGLWVQAVGVVFTTAVVLATLWLVGAIGWFAALIGVDWVWLKSPIGVGR
jgi:uncharacterized protein (TIGR02611 family)